MKNNIILAAALLALAPLPAFAQEQETQTVTVTEAEDTSYRFAPDHCDFEVTFPEAPYKRRHCPQDAGECYDVTSYTMVFDMKTTVDISITCNPSTPENFNRYTEDVMRAALHGMVQRDGVEGANISFTDLGKIRKAGLTGSGMSGRQEKIYTAQLWAGPNSVMTVKAELIGSAHRGADATFSEILASIHEKVEEAPAAEAGGESATTPVP